MLECQTKIREIQKDITLSQQEKSKKIQEIMMNNTNVKQQSNLSTHCHHYEKNCSHFEFECCSVIDPCRRCHLERNTCQHCKVKTIVCLSCKMKQTPSSHCVQCNEPFSTTYCNLCQLWTTRQIYHCEECGICRIGTREETFHCHNCKMCFSNENKEHECLNTSFEEGTCVVCNESVFNNQSSSFFLKCSHFIHSPCFEKYVEFGNYNCPLCKKSISDMTEHWNRIRQQIQVTPVPKDVVVIKENNIVPTKFGRFQVSSIKDFMYGGHFVDWKLKNGTLVYGRLHEKSITKNIYISIYCNDCEKKSSTLYHFYGLECKHCGGFNTQQ